MPSIIMNDNKFINQICSNTKSDLIEITEDKLENILNRFISNFKKVYQWLTPFTLIISILLTILTAEFNKDFIGIPKESWSSIFFILLLISIIWLGISFVNVVKFRNQVRIDFIIKKIKNN